MDLRLISTPYDRDDKLEVVSLEELKAQVRVTGTDEDDLLRDYVEQAYDYLAGPTGWLGRCALLTETYEEVLDAPLLSNFELAMRPLYGGAITSFESLGSDGMTWSAFAASDFRAVQYHGFPWVERIAAGHWPRAGLRKSGIYRVRYQAGFGTDKETIPSGIRGGIKLLAAHWYANREATAGDRKGVGEEIAYGLKALCGRHRIVNDHS